MCATFVIEQENAEMITAALNVIRSWCPDWLPQTFMSDFCPSESKAIHTVFPGKLYCITSGVSMDY